MARTPAGGSPAEGTTASASNGKITPEDLEAKFRELRDEGDEATDTVKSYVLAGAATIAVVIFVVAFASGRRRGKKKSTVVEIRRI